MIEYIKYLISCVLSHKSPLSYKQYYSLQETWVRAAKEVARRRKQSNHDKYVAQTRYYKPSQTYSIRQPKDNK